MSTRRSSGSAVAVGLVLLCILFLGAGCSEKGGGGRLPNRLPDTQISFGPTEQSTTYYKVQAFWYGTDEDGAIDHYEVALVKNVTRDSLPSVDYDALSWAPTARTESSFVLTADSCCTSIGLTSYGLSYWGILVRAVDNDGGVDQVPASLFFQASNALPRVRITIPHKSTGAHELVSPYLYLQWRGEDMDGDVTKLLYKYLLIPESWLPGGVWNTIPRPHLPPLEQDSSGTGHGSPPAGYWSEWVPADCTYVKDLNLSVYKGIKVMAFVTCKDEGGAVLPDYLYGDYGGDFNWVRMLISRSPLGVATNIDAGPLGTRNSSAADTYRNTVSGLFRGTLVSFKIWGSEDRSQGSLITAYRYYFDDPEDPKTSSWNYWTSVDPLRQRVGGIEWTVKYPADGKPFEPTVGPHIFVAELKDLNKEVTHCEFRIEVLPGPKGKDHLVYLVDDDQAKFLEPPGYLNYEQDSRAFWADVLDGYNWESFDTYEGRWIYTKAVPIRRVGDATTVIWLADYDDQGNDTHLLRVCSALGNYLNSYTKVGGNLIIIGKDPCYATMYWPDAPNVYDPQFRASKTSLDFTPRVSSADSSMIYNFMWEAFGIVKMQNPVTGIPFKTMAPCEAGWEPVSTAKIPGVGQWIGKMDNAFYITEVRSDIDVHKMYSMIPIDNQGLPIGSPECSGLNMKLVGVYVPGDGERGYAAYIAIPPWFFNHDQVKVMIRNLLEMFGEPRTP
jgi:hypothetical protein